MTSSRLLERTQKTSLTEVKNLIMQLRNTLTMPFPRLRKWNLTRLLTPIPCAMKAVGRKSSLKQSGKEYAILTSEGPASLPYLLIHVLCRM